MNLDPERLKALFAAALEKTDPQARAAFLDQACAGDTGLRAALERMLQAHAQTLAAPPEHAGESVARQILFETLSLAAADQPHVADRSASDTQAAAGEFAGRAGDSVVRLLAPAQRPDAIGRLAHYEVHGIVGKGGFGTVLKAFDEKLHRFVAVKVIAPELAAIDSAKERFVREARAAAKVRHPHVVGIHAVEDKPLPYLVMEYVAGETLAAKIKRLGALEPKEIVRLGHQIACGLAAAHQQGLVHRDIKPANILLEGPQENVKITDFGLARAADEPGVTQSGAVLGTPAYMSPEQAEGGAIDQRSDLFSLGTVLYAMCTGRPPFRAGSTVAVLRRVVEETPPPIRACNAAIPQWLAELTEKLLAKKPQDRFQSAQEVADILALQLAQLQQPTMAASERPAESPPRPVRRNRALAIAAFLGIALVLIVFFGLQSQALRDWLDQALGRGRGVPQPPEPQLVWEQLWNGVDLTGWRPIGYNGWTVKDGVLFGAGQAGKPGWLMSERRFADFELELEYKLSERTDSGVFLRAWPEGNVYGDDFTEVQLLDDRGFANLSASRKHGALFRLAAPPAPITPVLGAWQKLKVRVVDNDIDTWMDGAKVIEHTVGSMRRKGHIGLQLFPTRVEFRNIRVRAIADD